MENLGGKKKGKLTLFCYFLKLWALQNVFENIKYISKYRFNPPKPSPPKTLPNSSPKHTLILCLDEVIKRF